MTRTKIEILLTITKDEFHRLQLGHERYEYLRKLNPREFTELYQRNISGDGAFDDLVDRLIAETTLMDKENVK